MSHSHIVLPGGGNIISSHLYQVGSKNCGHDGGGLDSSHQNTIYQTNFDEKLKVSESQDQELHKGEIIIVIHCDALHFICVEYLFTFLTLWDDIFLSWI